MPRELRNDRGFTLLETVVTLAVISISLTVLYQVFSSVARGTHLSADYYRAVQIAETQLALLTATPHTGGGSSGSVDDYFRWRSSAQVYTPPADSPLAGNGLISAAERGQTIYRLSVNVRWGESREHTIELHTIRLEDGS